MLFVDVALATLKTVDDRRLVGQPGFVLGALVGQPETGDKDLE